MTEYLKQNILCEFTTEELQNCIAARREPFRKEYQNGLNINGITAADFKVVVFRDNLEGAVNYFFCILKNGEEHDIFNSESIDADWWPSKNGKNHAPSFIPNFLLQCSECCYESILDRERTIERLREFGFKNFEILKKEYEE